MNTLDHLELKRKLDPASKKGFQIKIKRKIEKEMDSESIQKEEVQQKPFKIVDRTKKSHIDRDSILERLLSSSKTEFQILNKSPVVREAGIIPYTISEYEKERNDYAQFSNTFLEPQTEEEKEEEKEVEEEEPRKMNVEVEKEKEKEIVEPVEEVEEKEEVETAEKPIKKQRTTRKKRETITTAEEPTVSNYLQVKIGNKIVLDRLPKSEKIVMRNSPYYMNNRKLFIQKLATIFTPYREKIQMSEADISCKEIGKENLNIELLTHQQVVRDYLNLYTPYRGLLLYHGLGSGKCHKINTPIIMSDGSIKMVQDIQVGDMLMGDDSQHRTVLSLARGRDKMYDIIPTKGEKYTVNQEHILCLRASGFPKISYNTHTSNTNYNIQWIENNKFMSKTFTYHSENHYVKKKEAYTFFENIQNNSYTNDNVFEIAVKDYLLLSKKMKGLLKGYKVPVDFPEKPVHIDPYMIGYWLGDGTSSRSEISCQDSTVLYYFAKNLQKYKLSLNYHNGYTYGISGNGKYNNNQFLNSLKELQLINNKHIPDIFKFNSREVRLQILAGLIDSDGHYDIQKNIYEFSQKNEKLMDDVIYLCRSLGFACYKKTKKTSFTYKGIQKTSTSFRINISGVGMETIPTIIPRKKSVPRKQIKDVLVSGIKVEYVNEDDYYGFMLNGNCRYLMGDFTVTHNTCTSIAIAEGMKSDKRIVLMTPASLKMNFFSELKKCGDHIYKKNQFWEFISIEGQSQMVSVLSQALSLDSEYIKSHGGAWMVDVSKPSNFSQLSSNDQKNLDEQINAMIRAKYLDINYNGLNKKKIEELGKGNKNPFDHSVVVIDEAHNLVSRIGNKLKAKKSIAYTLYQWLLDATDVRVVLLTGTPIINYPHEIGVLFNILRGHIKTWNFQLSPISNRKINKDVILERFQDANFKTYDYVEYSGDTLSITRNPFGFINTIGREKKGGSENKKENQRKTKKQPSKSQSKTKKIRETGEESESNELDPEFVKESNAIFTKPYEGGDGEVFENYKGVVLDVTGNISDGDFQKRIIDILKPLASIVGKPSVTQYKCLPDDSKKFIEMFIDPDGRVVNVDLFKRRILGLTSYFRSAQEKLLPSFVKTETNENYHTVLVEMSDHQFSVYDEIRNKEREQERSTKKASRKKMKTSTTEDVIDDKISSTYRIFSRAACNFAFPPDIERPLPPKMGDGAVDENVFNGLTNDDLKQSDDYFEEEVPLEKEKDQESESVDDKEVVSYQTQIENAMQKLAYNETEPRETNYLLPEGLAIYSPKFLKILENIKDPENEGLHLLYSQFRTIEGIGILKLILEANGYAQFKIQKKGENEWAMVEEAEDADKPKFILYTGTESAEEKEILRNIYISAWELVPQGILVDLRKKSSDETKNFMGEVIKLMMITSSGAEGINLRNCRYVHIVEPYWNGARLEQVIGRARRICSHQDLPEELRTVKVFVYISVIPQKLLLDKQNEKIREIREFDSSKKEPNTPFTTDQTLFEIAEIKDGINKQILKAIKETSIDCSLYNNNPEEPLTCYGFGLVRENQFSSYPKLETDLTEKVSVVEAPKLSWKGVEIEDPNTGMKYSLNPKTREIYDLESYKKNILTGSELILVGKLVEKKVDGKKLYVIQKI